jgi:hypothetical protein
MKIVSVDSRYPHQDTNGASPEYESGAIARPAISRTLLFNVNSDCLVERDTLQSDRSLGTFRGNLLPPYSTLKCTHLIPRRRW